MLVKIKSKENIFNAAYQDFPNLQDLGNLKPGKIISERFRRLFLGYSKAINKQEDIHGSLFQKYFRRKEITSPTYLKNVIHYIHFNPVHHEFVDKANEWQFSSYNLMLMDKPSKLKKQEVLSWFNNQHDYINTHRRIPDLNKIDQFIIEE